MRSLGKKSKQRPPIGGVYTTFANELNRKHLFGSVSQAKQIENLTGYSFSYTCHDPLHNERLEYGPFSA